MKKYTIFQVDAFTDKKFTGNPAGVVLDADGLSEKKMQEIFGNVEAVAKKSGFRVYLSVYK